MNCPVCEDSRMKEVEKDGVLIDICPSCKGVWLDRGELDKLLSGVKEIKDDFNAWHQERYEAIEKKMKPKVEGYNKDSYYYDSKYKKKKKKHVLERITDIFDI